MVFSLGDYDIPIGLKVGLLGVFFLLSMFFSMSETSLFSLGRLTKRRLDSKAVNRLLERPQHLLVDLLTGNNIVNILIASLATSIAVHYCRESGIDEGLGVGASILTVTVGLVIFGEIIPKTLGLIRSEQIAPKVAIIISLFSFLLLPVRRMLIWIMQVLNTFLEGILGLKGSSSSFTREEIMSAVRISHEEGSLEESEAGMIRGVFLFGERLVREIMIPRERIVSASRETGREDILKLIQKTHFSRIPIYEGSLDNIIGILHVRDFLIHLSGGDKDFNLKGLLHPVYEVLQDRYIDELWYELKGGRCQMAVVKDSDGRLVGLVTLEDLLEEIVGEIEDEHDLLVGKG